MSDGEDDELDDAETSYRNAIQSLGYFTYAVKDDARASLQFSRRRSRWAPDLPRTRVSRTQKTRFKSAGGEIDSPRGCSLFRFSPLPRTYGTGSRRRRSARSAVSAVTLLCPLDNLIDSPRRNVGFFGQAILRDPKWLHELFGHNFTAMDRGQQFLHESPQ